tara:strand:- start:1047 stop:3455 length:2409 start_codon:yes stop_codon:yes gene_type:complete
MTPEQIALKYLSASSTKEDELEPEKSEIKAAANSPESIASKYIENSKLPTGTPPTEEPKRPESGALDKVVKYAGGLAASANQGLIPFSDEMISGVRAVADPSLYGDDSTIGERYDTAHRQAGNSLAQFRNDNPNTAIATEMTGGFASPINKLGPVTKAAPVAASMLTKALTAGKNLGQNVLRNVTEAGIYGFGEGTSDSSGDTAFGLDSTNRIENSLRAAEISALLTGALDTGGRTVGAALDWWKLPNSVRPDGGGPMFKDGYEVDANYKGVDDLPPNTPTTSETGPIMMSNPRSVRASVYKAGLGKLPGASQKLDELNAPYVLRDRAAYARAQDAVDDEAAALAAHQRSAATDVKLQGRQERRGVELNQREGLAAARAAERQAIQAENLAKVNAAEEADRAVADAAEAAQRKVQADRQADEALNIETLQRSVPEGRRDKVTLPGNEGFNQALSEVNAAYDEAWGVATDLSEGTVASVIARAKKAQTMLGEADSARVGRIIADAEKLGEEGGSVKVLDELLRNSIDATEDQLVRSDLESIREVLRSGLPTENLAKLNAVDAVYPNLLATQKAASKAYLDNGVPTPDMLALSSNVVAGERRAAKGEQPMMPFILESARNRTPEPTVEPVLKAPAALAESQARLEKAAAREAKDAVTQRASDARLTVAERLEDTKADLSLRNKTENDLFKARSSEKIDPIKEKLKQTEGNARADSPSLYMAALLSNLIPGGKNIPMAARATGVASLGELLATMPAQEFIAGQGKYTRMLADALRSGRTEYITRALSRDAGLAADKEEEDYYIYR